MGVFHVIKCQGHRNLGHEVAQVTKSFMVASNICWSSVWNLLYVTHLVPRILKWCLDIWKICASLSNVYMVVESLSPILRIMTCMQFDSRNEVICGQAGTVE